MKATWIKTNNYYNRDVVSCDVWSKVLSSRRTIYIMDSFDNNFKYTFSCGANSEFSFSGSFFNTTITTLEQAIEFLNKFSPLWFSDDYKGIRELNESIQK